MDDIKISFFSPGSIIIENAQRLQDTLYKSRGRLKMSRNISSQLQLSLQVGNKDLDVEDLLPLSKV